jgi:FdhD protein
MSGGAVTRRWLEFRHGWSDVEAEVIEEALVTLYLNGRELATIMCTPRDQDKLALGFLKNEGLIDGLAEVEHMHISRNGCCVDVWLNHPVTMPKRIIITSGCGGGVTFDDPSLGIRPLQEDLYVSPDTLFELLNRLHMPGSLHGRTRGVHAAGLARDGQLLVTVEDVGRHNTIDKLRGACMEQGIETLGCVLLATGRVSSEMLRKAALMGCPVVASRNSPTSMSIKMAEAWNITLAGYVRQGSLRVYTHSRRLGDPGSTQESGRPGLTGAGWSPTYPGGRQA